MSRNWLAAISALVLSAVWIGACVGVFVVGSPDEPFLIAPSALTAAVVWAAPVILIWLACATIAFSVQTNHRLWQLESQIHSVRLVQASNDDIRSQLASGEGLAITEVAHQPEPVAAAEPPTEPPAQEEVFDFVEIEPLPRTEQKTGISKVFEEESLEEAAVISNSLIIRALNFAEDENDVMGIAAVETAAEDEQIAGVLRSSMQVLQTLVDAGISIDHLQQRLAQPDEWRVTMTDSADTDFAELSSISDRHFVLAARRLVRSNPEFEESAKLFRANAVDFLDRFVDNADDDEIAGLLNTRTYRAFLLLEHASD